jgi:symplekin
MFRPPARELCLDTLEHVYHTCMFLWFHLIPHFEAFVLTHHSTDEESRPAAGKVLAKWRPQAIQATDEPSNGSSAQPADTQTAVSQEPST